MPLQKSNYSDADVCKNISNVSLQASLVLISSAETFYRTRTGCKLLVCVTTHMHTLYSKGAQGG